MSAKSLSIPVVALPLILAGCSIVDQVRFTAAQIAGRAIMVECALSTTQRSANLDAINGWLSTSSHEPRAIALDCDGDGTPDL